MTYEEKYISDNPDILNSNHTEHIDWVKFLSREPLINSYSKEELRDAVKAARSWVTCACGHQEAEILRDDTGRPIDNVLAGHGAAFLKYIRSMWEAYCYFHDGVATTSTREVFLAAQKEAWECLKEIQLRAAYLLAIAKT